MQSDTPTNSVRRRGRILVVASLTVLGAGLAAAVYLYDHSRRDLIAPGVTVGGIDVGGLHADAARRRLQSALRATRPRLVTVRYGGRDFTLDGDQAQLRADVDKAVSEAVAASRSGWILSRSLRALLGESLHRKIAIQVSYGSSAVSGLLARVRAGVERPARNATVTVAASGKLIEVRARDGLAVDTNALGYEVDRALSEPAVRHAVSVPVTGLRPRVTTAMLAASYPAYIVVDRPEFKLIYYRHLRLLHTYPIAVGQQGLETPSGLHHILAKEVDPAWHVPHSAWAGALAGHVIPPGPEDPLVARWMAIDELGDGIHGTNEPESIGSAASHGCIRMLVPDVVALYGITPLGTPVYVI
jgi:lipoprotein-anchoring transpeptidase ErfK/SrfK